MQQSKVGTEENSSSTSEWRLQRSSLYRKCEKETLFHPNVEEEEKEKDAAS